MKQQKTESFKDIPTLAAGLRQKLEEKKYILLYAYNGTGKTRLSMAFKDLGKSGETRDTLYFNAFTQDLFIWDNDLENDTNRVLKLNSRSRFFSGIEAHEMETRTRKFLHYHVDFNFSIDTKKWEISFFRQEPINPENMEQENDADIAYNIKISRGEENIFIWCFFLAILQLVSDEDESYSWVKYIYIDDPVSSLDDNNIIAIGHQLAVMLKGITSKLHIVISSHHALFFNVMCNELKKADSYFMTVGKFPNNIQLRTTRDTPFFHHIGMLIELRKAAQSDQLYTYHFSMLRSLLEKSANFHGFNSFAEWLATKRSEIDADFAARLISILNHGGYSHFEPREMLEENKQHFNRLLEVFLKDYDFNQALFIDNTKENDAS